MIVSKTEQYECGYLVVRSVVNNHANDGNGKWIELGELYNIVVCKKYEQVLIEHDMAHDMELNDYSSNFVADSKHAEKLHTGKLIDATIKMSNFDDILLNAIPTDYKLTNFKAILFTKEGVAIHFGMRSFSLNSNMVYVKCNSSQYKEVAMAGTV